MRYLEFNDWVRPTAWRSNGQPKEWCVNPDVHDGRFGATTEAELMRRTAVRSRIILDAEERRLENLCE
jgi:hypothetical protein